VKTSLTLHNAAQVICVSRNRELVKRGSAMKEIVALESATVVLREGEIAWIGPSSRAPTTFKDVEELDLTGKIVLPGFVDSHTHLIFSGTRANEFEQRLQGLTYQQIAAAGGGINATVNCVRRASKNQLLDQARRRLRSFLEYGITTVEVKSGYGLRWADELKCLEAIAELNAEGPIELVPTFLGAHAIPPEFQNDRGGYVRLLIDEMLPEIARRRLAQFCDVFCDQGAFTLDESERILVRAQELGFKLKLHADELSPLGGANLAAKLGATSADHLLQVTDAGIEALAQSSTIATLLPGTSFFLGLPSAPARRMIERGLPIAIASDCNPGTCPTENLQLLGTMACVAMRMLPAEVISALTLNGAAAVGRAERVGSIEVGKQADLIVCDVPDYQQLFYHFGVNHVRQVIKRGQVVYDA
jgi:imidazolonepropionase